MSKNSIALTCAITCSFLWGTAFIAQDTGMDYIGPWTFSAVRLLLGFFALLPFFFIFEFKKIKKIKSKLLSIIYRSRKSLRGSSKHSLIVFKNDTASFPSIILWS